jgi:GxxExxY protein
MSKDERGNPGAVDLVSHTPGLDELTGRIIGCAHSVSNGLGSGFVEKVYEHALLHELRKSGMQVVPQHPLRVTYDGVVVGEFFADLLVQDTVLVELKAVSMLNNEHLAQALNYLRASGLPACLLLNFGRPKLELRRLHPSPVWNRAQS